MGINMKTEEKYEGIEKDEGKEKIRKRIKKKKNKDVKKVESNKGENRAMRKYQRKRR